MKSLHLFALAAFAAATPIAASAADTDASAPVAIPAPPAGKGQVVFFRPSSMGFAIKCTVRENAKMIGRVGAGKYYVVPMEPGVHTFTAKSEATDTVTVQVEPDETSYVKCKIAMGVMVGRPNLSPATDAEFAVVSAKVKPENSEKIAAAIASDDAERAGKAATAGASSN